MLNNSLLHAWIASYIANSYINFIVWLEKKKNDGNNIDILPSKNQALHESIIRFYKITWEGTHH